MEVMFFFVDESKFVDPDLILARFLLTKANFYRINFKRMIKEES